MVSSFVMEKQVRGIMKERMKPHFDSVVNQHNRRKSHLINKGAKMGKLILALAAAGTLSLLAGCIAVPASDVGVTVSGTTRSGDHAYPQGQRRDRDGDGVPNRQDRRPDNPNRY
jgi:hypothetical protein